MASPEYRMPKISVGDRISFNPDPHQEIPQSGIVTAVGQETICVNLFARDTYTMPVRDGVRHISDPKSKLQHNLESGLWDYLPQEKAMEKRLAAIEAALARK